MKLITLKIDARSDDNLIQINDIAIVDVRGVQYFPVISTSKSDWKLFHPCDIILCNFMNY